MTHVPLTIKARAAVVHLACGRHALVDAQDWCLISRFGWFSVGRPDKRNTIYAATKVCGRSTLMHRLILNVGPTVLVDHRNRNGLDNRKDNIRRCTLSQNAMNSPRRQSKTGFKGVKEARAGGRWEAKIGVNGRTKHLGTFSAPEDAALAYDTAAKELYGDFAILNYP